MAEPYGGFDPFAFFGGSRAYKNLDPKRSGGIGGDISPWAFREGEGGRGAGMYGLPDAFKGWDAAARYSFAPSAQFAGDMQPVLDFFKESMGKDWQKTLFGQASDTIEGQFRGQRAAGQTALARAGMSGGGGASPLAMAQLQSEAAARAGQLGLAAQMATMQGQALKGQAAMGLQGGLQAVMHAMMQPAYLQSGRQMVPEAPRPDYLGALMKFSGNAAEAAGAFA